MCVVSRDYGELGGCLVVCMLDKAKGFGHMSGDVGALPKCEVIH